MGDPDVVSTGLVVGGAALSAFGAGAVRRHYGRFGGRVWTVAGFLVTAAAAIAIAVAADAAWLSPGGLLCIAIAAASVLGAAVTVARGVVARRMSAPSGPDLPAAAATTRTTPGPPPTTPLPFDVIHVAHLTDDQADIDRLRSELPAAGVRMLFLWVFDAHTNAGLIDHWRMSGPVQLLRGGGSLGGFGTLAAAVTGRVNAMIEESPEEVATRLETFDYRRHDDGRFAVNTIMCSDRAWRVALDALVASTDVVHMDLGGFGVNNQGCTHELELLVDRVDLARVLLLVDDNSDVELLRDVLNGAWATMDAASPNRRPGAGRLIAVRAPFVGGASGGNKAMQVAIERQERQVLRLALQRVSRP